MNQKSTKVTFDIGSRQFLQAVKVIAAAHETTLRELIIAKLNELVEENRELLKAAGINIPQRPTD